MDAATKKNQAKSLDEQLQEAMYWASNPTLQQAKLNVDTIEALKPILEDIKADVEEQAQEAAAETKPNQTVATVARPAPDQAVQNTTEGQNSTGASTGATDQELGSDDIPAVIPSPRPITPTPAPVATAPSAPITPKGLKAYNPPPPQPTPSVSIRV